MSGILTKEFEGDPREVWVVVRGKYQGTSLREVAQRDPDYFNWMWGSVDDLTKEQVEAIELVAEDEGIDLGSREGHPWDD